MILNRLNLQLLAVGIVLAFVSCKKDMPDQDPQVLLDTTPYELQFQNFTLPPPNLPEDNPLTKSKVELGKRLFFETRLSSDGTISCASCHRQSNAFSDTARFSLGVGGVSGNRQSMALFNLAWHNNEFFWDGRAQTLREQALQPIENPLEMNESLENVTYKLSQDQTYKDQFITAFGTPEITPERMALALENFMLTIVSEDSKYDRYLAGFVELTDSEERGRELYFAEYNEFFPESSGADCAHCHSGNNFENDLYMNNGLDEDAEFEDFGREEVTGSPEDRAKFKVPSLRNIEMTSPYMHDGRFETLEEVVEHYNTGIAHSSTVDPALLGTTSTGLMLDDQEKEDLINFLKTLTDHTYLNNPEYHSP